ncbi:MAG: hypothetical protein KIT48_02835 [Pseudolabrys sp.]|nr:hypothetical protein [Pseudolabrys sp.]
MTLIAFGLAVALTGFLTLPRDGAAFLTDVFTAFLAVFLADFLAALLADFLAAFAVGRRDAAAFFFFTAEGAALAFLTFLTVLPAIALARGCERLPPAFLALVVRFFDCFFAFAIMNAAGQGFRSASQGRAWYMPRDRHD